MVDSDEHCSQHQRAGAPELHGQQMMMTGLCVTFIAFLAFHCFRLPKKIRVFVFYLTCGQGWMCVCKIVVGPVVANTTTLVVATHF